MNVYEQAHGLAKAIKESEEFKQFDSLKKRVDANPQLAEAIKDFQTKQMEIQAKQMMGEAPEENAMAKIQELYGIMMRDPLAAEFMQAQMRFSLMMNDVYKILGEAMGVSDMM